jgi:FkbM family methyltransferase
MISNLVDHFARLKSLRKFTDFIRWHPLRDGAWRNRTNYEPQVRKVINSIVKKGWICLDIGSNIGIVTDMLASQSGSGGEVIAFEAFKGNAEQLKKYLKKEIKAGHVKVHNLAVSDGSLDQLWLYPGRNSAAGEWNIKGQDLDGKETEACLKVKSTSLDDFFSKDFKIDFIKIDVEGAGGQVLTGAKRLIERSMPVILIEFHNPEEWAARHQLLSLGYRFYNLDGSPIPDSSDHDRVYLCYALPPSFGKKS